MSKTYILYPKVLKFPLAGVWRNKEIVKSHYPSKTKISGDKLDIRRKPIQVGKGFHYSDLPNGEII